MGLTLVRWTLRCHRVIIPEVKCCVSAHSALCCLVKQEGASVHVNADYLLFILYDNVSVLNISSPFLPDTLRPAKPENNCKLTLDANF